MKRSFARVGVSIQIVAAAWYLSACDSAEDDVVTGKAVVSAVCLDCHNDAERAGELTLEGRGLYEVAANAATWEQVVRKVRSGMMPPADGPKLDAESRAVLIAWLEGELDLAATIRPTPGRTAAFHRLNRNEYQNAIYDLLDVDIDISALLPSDDSSYGFDNIAGVLKVSPLLLERYLVAAEKVSRVAIGVPTGQETIDYYRVPDDLSQEDRLPDLPFGSRGGMSTTYTAPIDAEYVIAAKLARDMNEQVPAYSEPQQLEISVDGARVALFTLDGVKESPPEDERDLTNQIVQIRSRFRLSPAERAARNGADDDWEVRVRLSPGRHEVAASFLSTTAALDEGARLPFERPYAGYINIPETRRGAYLRSVEITGPLGAPDPASARSRDRIFVCVPGKDGQSSERSAACARQILSTLVRRGYRRDVSDSDVEPFMDLYRTSSTSAGFDEGIRLALKRLLISPEFIYRVEVDAEGTKGDEPYHVSGFELASRLSFFLWSSVPDEELLNVAASGHLGDREELARQVKRMLADQRSERFARNFSGQWLYLRNLAAAVPVQTKFPDFDDTLRQGLRRETELLVASIVSEDRPVTDVLRADYSFINERVARHYGIRGVKGSHFRRVTFGPDNQRRGLLGQGSILTVTSRPDRTSPVVRGKWVLENLFGTAPPDPPPDVPGLVETDGAGTTLAMRERLAAHRDRPACASCHAVMDPIGFALENYDAVGQWRDLGDAEETIDARGTLPDGTTLSGPRDLNDALLASDRFVQTLTEKLLTFALGRGLETFDMPTVRAIVREAARDDHRFSSLVVGIVMSPAFRMRNASAENSAGQMAAGGSVK
jgi:mono/diheme cytochrome c family protein